MATCSKCNANVQDGMAFCTACGAPMPKAAPPAPAKAPPPAPPKAAPPAAPKVVPPAPAKPLPQGVTSAPPLAPPAAPKVVPPAPAKPLPQGVTSAPPPAPPKAAPPAAPKVVPSAPAKPLPQGKTKFEGLDLELPAPDTAAPKIEFEEDEERRRASGAAGGVVCRFCKGPLDLEGGFCEYCGAPIEEAAPAGVLSTRGSKAAASASNLAIPPHTTGQPQAPGSALSPGPSLPGAREVPQKGPSPSPVAPPQPGAAPGTQAPKAAPPAPSAGARPPVGATAPPPAKPKPAVTSVTPPVPRAAPASPPPPPSGSAPAVTPPPTSPAAVPAAMPQAAAVTAPPAAPAQEVEIIAPTKKPSLLLVGIVLAVMGIVVLAAGAAGWYFLHRAAAPIKQPIPHGTTATAPPSQGTTEVAPPPPTPTTPTPETPAPTTPAPEKGAAEAPRPKPGRVTKPAPPPPPAPAAATPAANPQHAGIANFQNLARDSYAKGNYAEPAGVNAIAYAKQALAIDPNDDYSKKLLESAVDGGTYQVQQAIAKKDFGTAQRLADAMAQLLPGRGDVAGLKEDIASAQRAGEAAHRPQPVAPLASFRVMHMHTDKSPTDKGPYCEGTLSVSAGHLKFAGQSATDGQVHNFDFACSDVREVKKNARVASHQGGFHVRTTQANHNFVPADPGASPAPALASACSK